MSWVKWRLNPLVTLHWHCWHDEWVLFDGGSGGTHLMNEFVAGVLNTLSENGPMNLETLSSYLAPRLDLPNDEALLEGMRTQLLRLQELGLVEPATA